MSLDQKAELLFAGQLSVTAVVLGVIFGITKSFEPLPNNLFRYDLTKPFDLRDGWLLWAGIGLLGALIAIALTGATLNIFHGENPQREFSNYSSIDGALYCKPHYDQLFKMTGRLDKSFEGASKPTKTDRSNGQMVGANSRYASIFLGTQDKCSECKKTVYPIEKVAVNGNSYHRPCFRCSHGGCTISPANFVAHEGRLYCKHHHAQLFMTKGNFSSFSKVEEKPEEIKVVSADKLGAEAVQVS